MSERIDCERALERLLVAESADLTGRGDPELAAHLRECQSCAAAVGAILAGQAELAAALEGLRPATDVATALRTAEARVRRRLWRERAWRWGPIAAAAALAAAMVLSALSRPPAPAGGVAAPPAAGAPLVEDAGGRRVLVFNGGGRSATVIWFY